MPRPEQVWEALSSGALLDGWWMGENEVEPRLGGAFRTIARLHDGLDDHDVGSASPLREYEPGGR